MSTHRYNTRYQARKSPSSSTHVSPSTSLNLSIKLPEECPKNPEETPKTRDGFIAEVKQLLLDYSLTMSGSLERVQLVVKIMMLMVTYPQLVKDLGSSFRNMVYKKAVDMIAQSRKEKSKVNPCDYEPIDAWEWKAEINAAKMRTLLDTLEQLSQAIRIQQYQ